MSSFLYLQVNLLRDLLNNTAVPTESVTERIIHINYKVNDV